MNIPERYLIISATHGNEGFSVPVMQEILDKLPPDEFGYDWIIGNPKAYRKGVRFLERDMNRCAPGNPNSESYEERRVAEIVQLSGKYKFVIDIHGTDSACGITTLVPFPNLENILLASLLRCERNIIWNAPESRTKGPIVQYTGCPGIEIEAGPQDEQYTQVGLRDTLIDFITSYRDGTLINRTLRNSSKWYQAMGPMDIDRKLRDWEKIRIVGDEISAYLASVYNSTQFIGLKEIKWQDLFMTIMRF